MKTEKPDYTALDAAIIERARAGACTAQSLEHGDAGKEAEKLAQADVALAAATRPQRYPKPAFRFIDTRLQALRKQGRIVFSRNSGWHLA